MKYQLLKTKVMSAADNATYIGQAGEFVILKDTLQVVTHDGATAGGKPGAVGAAFTVAAAGSTIADAAALGLGINAVTGADATKGVILPVGAAGRVVLVKNATNAVLKVYPSTSTGVVNALSAGAAISMAALTAATFMTIDGNTWYTIPLLPS